MVRRLVCHRRPLRHLSLSSRHGAAPHRGYYTGL